MDMSNFAAASYRAGGQHLVSNKTQPDTVRAGAAEEVGCKRLSHVRAQIIPVVGLRENVPGEALGAVTAIGFLGYLENEFSHILI